MGGIRTAIELQDNFSGVLYNVCGAVNLAISSMLEMQGVMGSDMDLSSLEGARAQIDSASAALEAMNETIRNMSSPRIEPPNPQADQWRTDTLAVFNGSGMERYRQEIQSANAMAQRLGDTQDRLARQALRMDILPPEAFHDMNSLAARMDHLRGRIQEISENPVNMGTEEANRGLEQLRSQLDRAMRQQEELNSAMESGDLSAINSAYLRLTQTISDTERRIRDNTDEQGRFNRQIRDGTSSADKLMSAVKGIAAAYLSIKGIGETLAFSDELAQTVSRLDLMNDGSQATQQLFDRIYDSAKETHSSVMATADAIAKMGNNAGGAFANNEELIAFMEQINKQFVIGGASAQEQQNALVQLSQAMSAGALRGEELNSILDAAPGIARAIEQSMGWAEGSIKSYAEKGMVTAETVKASMLDMAGQTDTAFESMSVTFSQVLTDIQDDAIIAFQPVLQSLNDIANSEAFNSLVDTAIQGLTTLANSEALQRFVSEIENMLDTLNQSGFFGGLVNGAAIAFQFLISIATVAFDLLGGMAGFIAENWSIIAPVIYGVAAALAAYCIALGIYNGIQLISNGIKAASAFAENVHAASLAMETGATFMATAAQYGFNAALLACPITWIILMVIALIAIFYAVIGAVNKFAGTSISATGVICGAFMVALAVISNIFVTLWNVVVDVFVLIYNLIVEVANFIANVFQDPVGSVCRLFFGLADTVLGVLETLASAVDTLFGSNLAGAVSGWRETLSGWLDDTFGKGEEVWEKIDGSSLKLERYDYKDAYDSGYSFGKGIDESISNFFDPSSSFGGNEMKSVSGAYKQPGGGAGFGGGAGGSAAPADQIAANTGQTAANTAAIADSLEVSNEQLKYLRDVAERDAVNRFTTASIKVEMTNNNNVSSGMDLDGIVDSLTTAVGDAMSKTATGVHF